MSVRALSIWSLAFGILAVSAMAAEWQLAGDLAAHDPTVIKQDGTWWCFATGPGLRTKSSPDGLAWKQGAPLFDHELDWWKEYAPKKRDLDVWAPDLHEFAGRVWCYYAVSEFGRNNSAIGLKSCSNLAKADWRDDGFVIGSKRGTDAYNAIDPNLTVDADGSPWLVFGSWFDGIQLVRLDPATMKPSGAVRCIARRENGIEAPVIVHANGYYYLFVSIDKCCQGVTSTYKISFGRSAAITGPYLDKSGNDLLNGGTGTILEDARDNWKGPGGQDIYQNGNSWVIARHSYDANNRGKPALRISDLYWDAEKWPTLVSPSAGK